AGHSHGHDQSGQGNQSRRQARNARDRSARRRGDHGADRGRRFLRRHPQQCAHGSRLPQAGADGDRRWAVRAALQFALRGAVRGRQGGDAVTNSRRDMLTGAGAAAAMTFASTALAAWEPSTRYPDPAVQVLDPSFGKYRLPLASVERLSTGFRWAEGPVYFGDARCLLWSDIPNNRIMRWDEETGRTSVYRNPSNYANGNTRDHQGRLVTAEHGRRVTRTEYDGRV